MTTAWAQCCGIEGCSQDPFFCDQTSTEMSDEEIETDSGVTDMNGTGAPTVATATSAEDADGRPGPGRLITFEIDQGNTSSAIWSINLLPDIHDQQEQGVFSGFRACIEAKIVDLGSFDLDGSAIDATSYFSQPFPSFPFLSYAPVIKQDGKYFINKSWTLSAGRISGVRWKAYDLLATAGSSNYAEVKFGSVATPSDLIDTSSHPVFDYTGSPIQMGFLVVFSVQGHSATGKIGVAVDNVCLKHGVDGNCCETRFIADVSGVTIDDLAGTASGDEMPSGVKDEFQDLIDNNSLLLAHVERTFARDCIGTGIGNGCTWGFGYTSTSDPTFEFRFILYNISGIPSGFAYAFTGYSIFKSGTPQGTFELLYYDNTALGSKFFLGSDECTDGLGTTYVNFTPTDP